MRISQNHPRYRDIVAAVETRFNREFNEINLEDAERAADGLFEYIQRPSFAVLAKEWLGDNNDRLGQICTEFLNETEGEEPEDPNSDELTAERTILAWKDERKKALEDFDYDGEEFLEWLEESREYSEAINEHFEEREFYPMWNTLFEAKGSYGSGKIDEHVDELYEIGIGVISGAGNFESMLFIAGAGYSFTDQHWVPMMELFDWVDPSEFIDPSVSLNKCGKCGTRNFDVKISSRRSAELLPVQCDEAVLVIREAGKPDEYEIHCRNCGVEHFASNFKEISLPGEV